MNSYKISFVFFLLFVLAGCRKYVEEVPIQGQRVLEYTDDYRALMNNRNDQQYSSGLAPILSCDDLDLIDAAIQGNMTSTSQRAMYTWSKPFYIDQQIDYDWANYYSTMYVYNTVINGVMDSKGGNATMKSGILAEALLHRAFNYFLLVNLYSNQYDAATAASDPGVPLMLKPVLFVDLTRPSVEQVYDQMLSDINAALPLLPVKQDINFKPNKAAAFALLSKVYLNMRDFTAAAAFADSTLALSGDLYDFNLSIATTPYTFPSQFNDKQVLLRKVPRLTPSAPQLSQSLLGLLGTKDLRYVLFVKPGNNFYPAFTGQGYWSRERTSGTEDKPAVGLTVNETWLIKAECLARAGKKDEAVDMLNTLRKRRFKPVDYVALTAASADEALKLVIDERRREFFGTGLRWFDQRRLNKDVQFTATITRKFNNVTYTLEPNSNAYVFPLANLLIAQNPEMQQNP
ncbi:RagB/SusD family nutrient uptake outer membrane protein [Niastella caeni]|uniref:RagB/SusD family nutrient uptake outer membrane protein n=1 Tax=Niastella caeni TaxID=2569763 RepID=A0A4S8HMP8_9BACT|nr:RagB/SusD family nutrient uptake outer membrane protein [Niastella caeni]THU35991.1 RagB/SusD family nutrient uptake outer membrane protein [Niastella caeni]